MWGGIAESNLQKKNFLDILNYWILQNIATQDICFEIVFSKLKLIVIKDVFDKLLCYILAYNNHRKQPLITIRLSYNTILINFSHASWASLSKSQKIDYFLFIMFIQNKVEVFQYE